jgi:alpha-tubulin suppressor-like RCC1 family protein
MKRIITILLVSLSLQLSAQCVQKAGAGSSSTFVIKTDGTLWSWGRNNYGQLGIGNLTNTPVKTQVGTASNWQNIEGGQFHTVAIKADGTLWTWGFNGSGQLGLGNTTDKSVPTQVSSSNIWSSIAAGYDHTVAITNDGKLYAWGLNDHGQLGDGSGVNRSTPQLIGTGWKSVTAGKNITIAIKTDGTLWGWGEGSQVGNGTTADKYSPVQLGTANNWKSVSHGVNHTLATKTDGTLWAWGTNLDGQLGSNGTPSSYSVPTQVGTDTNWDSVKAGFFFSIGRKTDGTIWGWGWNIYHQLGLGSSTADVLVPTQIGTENDWQAISVGTSSLFAGAIKNDGSFWMWGYNNYSQLGNGLTAQLHVPTLVTCPGGTIITQTACDSYTWAATGITYTASGTYIDPATNNELHLTINNSTTSTLTETACDSYTWAANGTTYTTSGTYTHVTTNAAGCPNTATLNLTINNSTTSTVTETACDSYTWAANGTTYTTSGTYTHVTTNAAGCPNTATLNLTINNSTTSTVTETACNSYTWTANGTTYTTSGTYTYVTTNATGCPNTATLNLTINNSTTSTVTETACDSYTWAANGTTYTTSGTYTHVTTNAAGCPNTATLNLTINNSTTSTLTETACDSYTWAANGTTYTTSGTYTHVTNNAAGCPNTATLNLTINNSTTSTVTETACDSYTWAANGTTYTTSGTYTNVTTNAAGCPNTATLNLTINNSEAPVGESLQTITGDVAGDVTISDIVISPSTVVWYASESDALSLTNPLNGATTLVNGATYYAVYTTNQSCSSAPLAVTVSVVLGTNSFNDTELRFYPNPTSDLLYISYGRTINTISVNNVLGQEVYVKSINAEDGVVDFSNLPSGNYFVKVTSGDSAKMIKIIKR